MTWILGSIKLKMFSLHRGSFIQPIQDGQLERKKLKIAQNPLPDNTSKPEHLKDPEANFME